MDGREFELQVVPSDLGQAIKQKISMELRRLARAGDGQVSSSRLKLVAGQGLLGDFDTLGACGIAEGDEITVIILSPLHGMINRSGLVVPLDVMELKMELNDALEARRAVVA